MFQKIPTTNSQRAALRAGRMSFGRNALFHCQRTDRHTACHRKTNVPKKTGDDKQSFE